MSLKYQSSLRSACVGINPGRGVNATLRGTSPRPRGDPPSVQYERRSISSCVPYSQDYVFDLAQTDGEMVRLRSGAWRVWAYCDGWYVAGDE